MVRPRSVVATVVDAGGATLDLSALTLGWRSRCPVLDRFDG